MKRMISIIFLLVFAALLLAEPETAAGAVRDGMELCGRTVIPSLFPFFVVTTMLLRAGMVGMFRPLFALLMRALFRMRGECATPLLIGFLGGYPAGARSAAQLYEQGSISRGEAERLLGFCNNCGPGFLVGFVGAGVFGSSRTGAALLGVHIASALISGVILSRLPGERENPCFPVDLPSQRVSLPAALTEAVSGALASTLSICAYVVFFRTAAALLPPLPAPVLGAVEMVSGVAALGTDSVAFAAAAGITAWGGAAVHCQTMAVTGELSLKYHTLGKLLQAVIAAVLAALVSIL